MLKFIKATESPTLEDGLKPSYPPFQWLSPSLYIGNPSGYLPSTSNYDISDENSLKHLKISVSNVTGVPHGGLTASTVNKNKGSYLLQFDTMDLYSGYNHFVDNNINKHFEEVNRQKKSSPAAPVSFNRIHFYAEKAGQIDEYYSIFLAGTPVKIDPAAKDFPEGSGSMESKYDERIIIGANPEFSFKINKVYYDEDGALVCKLNNGEWVHRYQHSILFSDKLIEGSLALNQNLSEQWIYLERTSNMINIGTSASYPVSSTNYLRRAIGYVLIDVSKKKVLYYRNCTVGDIYTW